MVEIPNWPTALAYIVGTVCFTIVIVTFFRGFFK